MLSKNINRYGKRLLFVLALTLSLAQASCGLLIPDPESLQKKADNGDVRAQMKLFYEYYEKREQGKEYLDIAVKYLKMAAEKEDSEAMYVLGKSYLDGDGIDKNYDKAFDLLYKSSYMNNPDSQYFLSYCYFTGKGTTIDKATGYAWFVISCENNNKVALSFLMKIKSNMSIADIEASKRKYKVIKSSITKR